MDVGPSLLHNSGFCGVEGSLWDKKRTTLGWGEK